MSGGVRWRIIRGAGQCCCPVASWSRDTAVACFSCCDGADAAATELMLRAARVSPRGAAASLLEVLPAALLRVASLGRDAQNEEASIRFPPVLI